MEIPTPDALVAYLQSVSADFLIFTLLTAALIYLLTLIIYRLYFHPLSSFPGPFPARITRWYDVYHAYRGDKHINFLRLHEKYGTVVRFSPNSLAINDPAALKAIYGHGANVRKSDFYRGFRAHPAAISTLLATEKVHHTKKRRILGQAFSEQAMRELERFVLENVSIFGEEIDVVVHAAKVEGKVWSERLDMGKLNNYLVFGESQLVGLALYCTLRPC